MSLGPQTSTPSWDFERAPFTAIWEVTRACDLRCVHCRADASESTDPRQLSSHAGLDLLEQVRDLAPGVLVLTGGDPLKRVDLFDLVERARDLSIPLAVTPSGTPLLTRTAVERLQSLGVRRMALSLDGPNAVIHDGFRRQAGSFELTLNGTRHARACGLPVQINTTVTRHNLGMLPALAGVIEEIEPIAWSVFFLVAIGRASASAQLSAAEIESTFSFLYELSRQVPFGVRTAAAPHYRRFVLQRQVAERRAERGREIAIGRDRVTSPRSHRPVGEVFRAPAGVTDGRGLVFISHTGEVYPSGFLPLSAGNVCRAPLGELYRNAPLFRRLRDASQLGGKCGICEFRHICGGSRARAYERSGDPMAEEPLCAYQPGAAGCEKALKGSRGLPGK